MTISNSSYSSIVYEIAYEAVDGTFQGTFLQGLNWPDTDPTIDDGSGPGGSVSVGTSYVDASSFIDAYTYNSSAIATGSPFARLVISPAVARIQSAHGPVPFRMIATRVYVTPATYSTSP